MAFILLEAILFDIKPNSAFMDIFLEKQFVKRWWLFMFILAIIVVGVGTAYYATINAEEATAVIVSIVSLIITVPLVFALLSLRLETRIDEKGVFTRFRPFGFTRKYYNWNEIVDIYVRTYDPLTEYGGWGFRGIGGNNKAYNVAGNKGIQVVLKSGEKFLIGTQKTDEAKKVISRYRKNDHTAHEI
ncbi:hypothetical protein [Salinimicrobium sp. GXAS 041]|uniref:hypothetical protein n=1 Tax=Salinimicrobium sp. GXAS 041 TaxID=3400806 RepID=UPI003C76D492